ncbi:hypothetical protein AK812_SmicGene30169 [Symbiodinium microadriaticum]|uniref:Uncharacterized protein n=1 Tax=Symbiodinium microadriaticum TaxID=2951 RepID=A0A1Q9CZX9_SYMMI|nr:hypothetical protein AK812_SmicGene30169 [Symbiodinium microadriaticum]
MIGSVGRDRSQNRATGALTTEEVEQAASADAAREKEAFQDAVAAIREAVEGDAFRGQGALGPHRSPAAAEGGGGCGVGGGLGCSRSSRDCGQGAVPQGAKLWCSRT